jgi:hypothetical protein
MNPRMKFSEYDTFAILCEDVGSGLEKFGGLYAKIRNVSPLRIAQVNENNLSDPMP